MFQDETFGLTILLTYITYFGRFLAETTAARFIEFSVLTIFLNI